MSGPGLERLLAATALALIFAGLVSVAQENDKLAAVPTAAAPVQGAQDTTGPAAATQAPTAPSNATQTTAPPPAVDGQPAITPDALAALDPADRAIAEKIRDLFAARSDRIFTSSKERMAMQAFYQKRNLAPLWLDKGIATARAQSVIARLKRAGADGLQVSDYRTPDFSGMGTDALAEADLKLTQTVLSYARHVQAGRFSYKAVSRNIELAQAAPDPSEVLTKVADAADPGKALDEFSPQHEGYQKLKAALAELRGKTGGTHIEIADGAVLRPNPKHAMQDPRVPPLRERLGVPGDASDLSYDNKLAEAVRKFQRASDLPPTGNLDARTLRELNGPTHDRQIDTVIANMERWRWYPRDLGTAHVIVNQPDFTLKVMHNGAQVWTTRIVIGKPSMQTPLLSETMKYITINPTWNVPPSIVHNEYLPALARDPTVLARMGLRVHYGRDGVSISQPPGDRNALGRVRFNFANRFLVYQHDTPDKYMFAHDMRAYSHGCMRVQDPAKYAEVLLNIARPDEHWTAEKVKSMFGGAEQDVQLQPAPIWVHLTYQSAFVDETGKLQIRRDVYNLDGRTLAAIRNERGAIDSDRREPEIASYSRHRRTGSSRSAPFYQSSWFASAPPPLRPPRGLRRIYYR
jgi:L,D-transpeptidase YcbB